MDNKDVPNINASNSVFSIGQEGGITAHTVNINEFPEPKFEMKVVSANAPQNDLFEARTLLSIESKTALKNLYLEAKAPSIVSLEVVPQRTGMSMKGHTGKRDGVAFTNLLDAWGQYMLLSFLKGLKNTKLFTIMNKVNTIKNFQLTVNSLLLSPFRTVALTAEICRCFFC